MDIKKQVVKAAREGRLFDFLASDGWKLSKEELLAIAKEAAFAHSDKSSFKQLAESIDDRI